MYRGDGDGGWLTGNGEQIGSGWESFSAIIPGGDFSGDGKPDVLAVHPDGRLLMYRGNGAGGWVTGSGRDRSAAAGPASRRSPPAATSAATASPTSSRAAPTARCCSTAATARAAGSPARGEPIGSGWNGLNYITLVPASPPPPAPAPAPAPPRAAGRPGAGRQHLADRGRALHAARRAPARVAEGPPPRRAPGPARAPRRVLRARRPAPRRSPPARTSCACASTAPRARAAASTRACTTAARAAASSTRRRSRAAS